MTSTKNLSCLIESSKIINSSLRLPTILNTVTAISKKILQAEAGSLMLLDKKNKELVFAVALGKKGHKIKKNIRVKIGKGISGTVAKMGKPILVKNVHKDPRFVDWVDKFSGFKTHSILCVPLKAKGKIIGIMEAINSHHKKGFSEKDLDVFQAFASQVAIAIDNAQMHQKILAEQKIDSELEIARQIQQNLLPKECISNEIDICGKNIPAEQVGGDLYDFFDLGSGKTGIMISDVSGKGIPAALYMMRIMSEFRLIAKEENDLGKLLSKLNNILFERSILGMFATLFYIVIDITSMKIQYSSAGHIPALCYSKGSDKLTAANAPLTDTRVLSGDTASAVLVPTHVGTSVDPTRWLSNQGRLKNIEGRTLTLLDKAQNPPLGVMPKIQYKAHESNLTKGANILLYTDGVIEARDRKGQEYSQKRLEEVFCKAIGKNIIDEISQSLKKYTEGAKPHDDCTFVSIQL